MRVVVITDTDDLVLRALIENNAATLRRLHDEVDATYRRRSTDGDAAWTEAVRTLKSRYDELAFPGGLSNALPRLLLGDAQTLETAVIYLEVHPRFFRSQYNTKKIIQLVKKHPLRSDLQERFQQVLDAAHARKIARRKAWEDSWKATS